MKLKLNNVPIDIMVRIKSSIANAKNNNAYLSSVRKTEFSLASVFIIFGFFIFFIFLSLIQVWQGVWFVIILGVFLSYFSSRAIQKSWNWWTLGKDAIFFDSKYCISIIKDELTIIPINDYKYADIISSPYSQDVVRFHFEKHPTLYFPFINNEVFSNFRNLLKQVSDNAKNSVSNNDIKQSIPDNFLNKISNRKTSIIIAGFVGVILWFLTPMIIDYHQYQSAKNQDTATSYRTYLNESRNIRYRENARSDIKNIYDKYINKYMSSASGISGAKSFKEILEYLRDNDLFSIEMIFNPSSELKDIESSKYEIKSVTPSFTNEKNEARQNEVINTVKASLAKIFPTDIIAISNKNTIGELPRFEIYYSYKNNPESIYFPTEQSSLAAERRTWFYGIAIEWYFKISLKTKPTPIYDFTLLSEPAPHLTAATLNSDDVYSSMATSAFSDFQSEFQNHFFNTNNITNGKSDIN